MAKIATMEELKQCLQVLEVTYKKDRAGRPIKRSTAHLETSKIKDGFRNPRKGRNSKWR